MAPNVLQISCGRRPRQHINVLDDFCAAAAGCCICWLDSAIPATRSGLNQGQVLAYYEPQ
jgi:hypothetical protein